MTTQQHVSVLVTEAGALEVFALENRLNIESSEDTSWVFPIRLSNADKACGAFML